MAQNKRPADVLAYGGLVLDRTGQTVIANGKSQHLTKKECQLLATFMQYPGEVLSRAFLMRNVWETDYWEDTRTLEVHVSMLRKKIEQDSSNPRLIQTVRRVGYVFVGEV